ncbi:hypothetical protein [Nocardiopsis alborubida]|uniref:Uncharacterized protein n=1 Tax=Nocardiopsis alborubida TaxID=146802 RepID=A0A7X6M9X0_9ACTN|nr:hypothetical protein [Nocardiopsis alborubida]NKY96694.1 hypothetical protein [Nocardiopsis alborubida]
MIAAVDVEPATSALLVAEWRWWATKHLQGALASCRRASSATDAWT